MKRVAARYALGAVGVCLAVAASSLPASALVQSGQSRGVHPLIASEYLAGFTAEAQGDGSVESITLPPLNCRANSYDAIRVGVGQESPDSPTPHIVADVYLICDNGVASYKTEALVKRKVAQGVANEGDVVSFDIHYKKHGKATATVTNTTDGAGSVTVTGKARSTGLHFGAFPVVVGNTLSPVPTFDKVRFVRAYAAGQPLKGDSAARYQRVNDGQTKLDVTDTIRIPPNAGSFSVIFKHN